MTHVTVTTIAGVNCVKLTRGVFPVIASKRNTGRKIISGGENKDNQQPPSAIFYTRKTEPVDLVYTYCSMFGFLFDGDPDDVSCGSVQDGFVRVGVGIERTTMPGPANHCYKRRRQCLDKLSQNQKQDLDRGKQR